MSETKFLGNPKLADGSLIVAATDGQGGGPLSVYTFVHYPDASGGAQNVNIADISAATWTGLPPFLHPDPDQIVLLDNQTDMKQNGFWQVSSDGTSLARPSWFADGTVFDYGVLAYGAGADSNNMLRALVNLTSSGQTSIVIGFTVGTDPISVTGLTSLTNVGTTGGGGGGDSFAGARVYRTGVHSGEIPAAVPWPVNWDTVLFDTGSYWSADNGSFVVPAGKDGYYRIEMVAAVAAGVPAGTTITASLAKGANGDFFPAGDGDNPMVLANDSHDTYVRLSCIEHLVAGDTIQVTVQVDAVPDMNQDGSSSLVNAVSWASMTRA